ncbi:isoleucine--tRNA ligase [Holospora curviuscula]|uniref:Isoleucine--tRNA ligase n=1 Tax=Holospora curviuscula TaxID=1082868 RepID=A0A2S5R804_9PROT|nr:isoleucine--tRNA ligase [Holospora curviuscula]PPE03448.1 Isoleucine--tRNA ligase [Holospora curviuscula]
MSASYPVLLPKTQFPMKGDLGVREPITVAWWKTINLYALLRELRNGKPLKVLADGPPYANGPIHLGHALNKILKDMVNRFNVLHGFDIDFVPGWDCHGLPIEAQIEKQYLKKGIKKREISGEELRTQCREFAEHWIQDQSSAFQRLGVMGQFDTPYCTMEKTFEASVIQALFELFEKDYIYQGTRPVLWSCAEQTALAEAEVEYQNITSLALYVKFPVHPRILSTYFQGFSAVSVIIWTTTPWSIPGNRGICYHPELSYVCIRVEDGNSLAWEKGEGVLVAQDRLSAIQQELGVTQYSIISTIPEAMLRNIVCLHPLYALGYTFDVPLLPGTHVTCDIGTGFVHTAPSHGPEDFVVGLKYKLEIPETILPDGKFASHVPRFFGVDMWKANIKEALEETGMLVSAQSYLHSYPHSWRSKTPLCYRTTPQWFIRLDTEDPECSLRAHALSAIEAGMVSWHPRSSAHRLSNMLRHRPDWCISRQRAWGIPLMFFLHKETGVCLKDSLIFQALCERVQREGVDFWFTDAPFQMFPELSPQMWTKVEDIMDVWLESGLTHRAVLKSRSENAQQLWPAWTYFEGSDQHRGWFQSSLLTGVALEGRPPFQSVLTHGFLLDAKGEKQSKSQGNGIDPVEFSKEHGADLLRLWVAHEDYEKDIRVGEEVFARVKDMYKKCRNTLRFMLGALHDLSAEELLPVHELDFLSRRVLHTMHQVHELLLHSLSLDQVTNPTFQGRCLNIQSFLRHLVHFCTDLSVLYFDIKKDTLYCDAPQALARKQVRTTLVYCFMFICKHLAPILSFTAEEAFTIFGKEILRLETLIHTPQWKRDIVSPHANKVWQWLHQNALVQERAYWSVHLQDVFTPPSCFGAWEGASCNAHVLTIRREVTEALEVLRKNKQIKSSLEAGVCIGLTVEDGRIAEPYAHLYENIFLELCLVSNVKILWDQEYFSVKVEVLAWNKCPRCWKLYQDIQKDALCARCETVLASLN